MISHWFSLTKRNEYVVTGASGSFTCIQCQAGTYSTGIGAYFDLSCTYAHNLSSICTWFCLASQCKATLGFPKVSLHCAWVWFCSLLLIKFCWFLSCNDNSTSSELVYDHILRGILSHLYLVGEVKTNLTKDQPDLPARLSIPIFTISIERHSPCYKRLRSVVESLLELEFWVGPLISNDVHCSSIIWCFNAEDSFITGASSQVSCWQCVSGTFSTAAGALRIVILCDYNKKISSLLQPPGSTAQAQEMYSEPLFIRCDVV